MKADNGKYNERMANLDLLRITAMLLVVVLHFLGKGNWLTSLKEPVITLRGYLAWAIEALAIVAVNAYMLLSGYFLVESPFKVKRLLRLLLQIWFYTIGIGIVAMALGYVHPEGSFSYWLSLLCFPVSAQHYWFMSVYVFMYLFIPVMSQGIKKLTKKQFQAVLLLQIFMFSFIKSVMPGGLNTDGRGYDLLWYLCVFMIAAYIRLYGLPFFKNARRSLLVYLASAAGIFGVAVLFRIVYLRTGKLEHVQGISYDYNYILVLAASVGFFYLFYHIKIGGRFFSRVICRIAPYTLGVYLWHEHLAVKYNWPGWFYAVLKVPDSTVLWVLYLLLAVAAVFIVGILLDMLRELIFKGAGRLLLRFGIIEKFWMWLDRFTVGEKTEASLTTGGKESE